jgi:hypothetical protein
MGSVPWFVGEMYMRDFYFKPARPTILMSSALSDLLYAFPRIGHMHLVRSWTSCLVVSMTTSSFFCAC